jgi:signal transduction histidine kinase/ligand-binding sensor domain-containing protein
MCASVQRANKYRWAAMALGILLACCRWACALDPSLDISQYAHTVWKVRDGFSKGFISSIAQTPDGYLWLGTEFGLLRFDGVRNIPWQAPAGEHLPGSEILSLLAARDGSLWIGTRGGLASWKGGKLTQYPELAGQAVGALLEDREGTVWAGGFAVLSPGRLCAFQNNSVHCSGGDGRLGYGVLGLYDDSKDNLWAAVPYGLWRWKPGPSEFHPMPDDPDSVQPLGEGDGGALLFSTRRGTRRFLDGKTEVYPLPGNGEELRAHRMLRDRNGGVWFGTSDRGLVHVHQGRTDVFSKSDGLSGDDVATLFEDREGNIWALSLDGLDRFRDFAAATFSVNQGLSSALVGSVIADRDGSVWVGTANGLDRWNNGQITIYRGRATPAMARLDKRDWDLNGLALGMVREITDSGLPENLIGSLFQDSRGRIWVPTLHGFGYMQNGRFISLSGVPGGIVLSIAEDIAGNLWVANDVGLLCLDRGGLVQQIPWERLGRKNRAVTLIADPLRHGLWLGFLNGGVAYFADGRIHALYSAADGLGEGRVNGFRIDPDGTLWVATEGGLSRLKNGRAATLTSKNGLPCDSVHWAMEDDDHAFWLQMACGLVRVSRSELDAWVAVLDKQKDTKRKIQITVFDSSYGLVDRAHAAGYAPHVAKSRDGKLWFPTLDGVSVLDPRHLPFNKLPPPVHIEQINADRNTYWQNWSGEASSLPPRLPPRVRDLEIDYTALSLVEPEKVRFRVKLEGFDRDWQDVDDRRQAFYTNLSPRNYRFRVAACNNSGVWNEAGDTLDFSIAPAYYQTFWFRAACLTALLGLLWAAYQLRLRQLAREFNMRLEERVSERTRIARDLHDTLLQSFHGLLLRFQTVSMLLPDRVIEAKERLDSAIDQAAQAITEGRDAVQDLRSSATVTNDLAAAIGALGQELAAHENGNNAPIFRIEVEGATCDLHPILRDEVFRIAAEALRNAFRHGQARQVEVEIHYDERDLQLHVRDDGKGIDAKILQGETPAGHFGLHGMRERAESVGGRLEVWSERDSGTEVALTIPASIAYNTSPRPRRPWQTGRRWR